MSTLSSAGLKKSFESKTVIHNVSLEVNSGEIVGLLGPNGAGKSTLIKSILGLSSNYIGNIKIFNEKINKVRNFISYVPQKDSVD